MRTGVLGGTFDPPHLGHLVLADQCAASLALDEVLFVPAFRPPHKLDAVLTPFDLRVAMLRAAVANEPRASVLTLERDEGGISYTVRTLELLVAERPADELWLLVGEDSLDDLVHWRAPERIAELARIAVYHRRGAEGRVLPFLADRVTFIEGPLVDVSSSEIRERVAAGRSVRHLVPPAVLAIIAREGLYGGGVRA